MKALTLTPPWGTLVACGAKTIETRSWSTSYRGPLLIHQAKGFPRGARELLDVEPFRSVLAHEFRMHPPEPGVPAHPIYVHDHLPRGTIVAWAYLSDVLPTSMMQPEDGSVAISEQERAFGDFSPGRFAWVLEDVVAMRRPGYPTRGHQRVWNFPDVEWFIASNMLLPSPLTRREVEAAVGFPG